MKKRVPSSMTVLTLLAVTVAALAVSLVPQGTAKSQDVKQTKQKNLREIAMERDVEVEGVDGSHLEYATTLESLGEAKAIVYGRIIDSKSFFDPSSPIEYGESITTEYMVDVLRVIKDKTLDAMPGQVQPAPLSTPLRIARNGGVVNVNGHRASVTVRGYEFLNPGKQYVFFLFWSRAYGAYVLAHGISGVVMVNDDLSLKPLAPSKEIQSRLRDMKLESFIDEIK